MELEDMKIDENKQGRIDAKFESLADAAKAAWNEIPGITVAQYDELQKHEDLDDHFEFLIPDEYRVGAFHNVAFVNHRPARKEKAETWEIWVYEGDSDALFSVVTDGNTKIGYL